MQASALKKDTLKQEAINLINALPESSLLSVVQFIHSINTPSKSAIQEARNKHDLEIINANAEYLNAGAEENLEFQADIWEDEE